MKTRFLKSFLRDLKKIRDAGILPQIEEVIRSVEAADRLQQVANLRKMSGGGSFYRLRVGDYRLGLTLDGDVVEFVRVLHRRDIYRYFPSRR